ncbi:MAG: PASTA domain-containing protein [Clostridia bacterium]|nr:PASTA domain-containing protein [Clostridia bacterium]
MNNQNENSTSKVILARGRFMAAFLLLCLCYLIYRLAILQIVDSEKNKNAATDQYTTEITIQAKRGNIYDRNNKLLATSTTVQTVFISPQDIADDAQAELIADGLSRILGVEKSEILEKAARKYSKYQIIKKNLEEDVEMEVREFIAENKLSLQVCLEEGTKRVYPYGTLASHVIGFVGAENTGLDGIEKTYNKQLSGVNGRAIQGQDGQGNDLPFQYESYIDAQNGEHIITTIDYTIQSILTKYLKECYELHKPTCGCRGIIMDVKTGEILACSSIDEYDLNNYTELTGSYLEKYEAFKGTDEEKAAYRSSLLYDLWKNKVASELYEPGSTFKIITTAIGLEEGVFTTDSTFTCTTEYTVLGHTIHCHSKKAHGVQTVSQALVNSCNPAFVQMGLKIGGELFSKYFKAFGYTETVNSDITGEARSIYYSDLSNQLTLANCSFGQSMSVNMLQHIAAVSSIANGGYIVTPHIIKGYIMPDGTVVNEDKYTTKRAVISKETADTILKMLVNSTKNAAVSGYNISSKTGTSQKMARAGAEEDKKYYIGSCVSFAPAEDPEIAILVVVDEPTSGKIYGSQLAAPVISSVLSEVLPYLEILPSNENNIKTLKVDDYTSADIERAKYAIEAAGLNCVIKGSGSTVADQLPRLGTTITEGGTVILYTDKDHSVDKVRVKDLVGMTPNQVFEWAKNQKVNVIVDGIYNREFTNCYAISQSVRVGEQVNVGSVIYVSFNYKEDIQ